MLVLGRYRDQSIIIDGHIKVTVVDIRGDKVRLGIEAPKDVAVHREEVQERIDRGEPQWRGRGDNLTKSTDPS